MNKKILLGAITALIIVIAIGINATAYTVYGDVTCSERFVPRHIFFCTNPDGSLKGFNTFEAMDTYYVPNKVLVPDSTYLYVDGGQTEGLSGI